MTIDELSAHIRKQLRAVMACDLNLSPYMENAVKRYRDCYQHISAKYQKDGDDISPYNSNVYCHFLYFLSNTMYRMDHSGANAEKIYYLNKALNSVELFYAVELPAIWNCEHPLGAVIGRASYGDYFCFYQNCNVGGNIGHDGKLYHPQIGHHVLMYPFSRILGGVSHRKLRHILKRSRSNQQRYSKLQPCISM